MKKVFKILEKYWYLFVILCLTLLVIGVSFVENTKIAQLVRTLKHTATNYKKRVDTIDNLSDKKSKKDKQMAKIYEKRAKEIQEKREQDLVKASAKKIQIVEELKDKSAEDLANKMKEEFKL
jgi:Sec-independent protein translocase protein TatA